ncbi:MAG: hypothetical protein KJ767_02610 [Nanoarchaeota archaeon]|nr:hypothetical protein [Nanoarchaeota archaeon]
MSKRGLIILVPILIIIAFSLTCINVEARQTKTIGSEVMIDLIRYDPAPVQQGEPFDVWFEIRNIYGQELKNIQITMSSPLPFMKIQGEKYTTEFRILGQDDVKTFKYTLITSNEIRDGDYSLSLNYYSDRLGEWITEKYTVKIKKVNFVVSTTTVTIESEEIESNKIAQGKTAKLNVNVWNNADYLMKDVNVRLDLSAATSPIITIGSTTEKTIKEIPSGQESSVSFDILALPSADSGVYKIPIKIKYYDELGNNYTKDDLVGLIIGSEPSLHLEIRENEIYDIRGTGDVDANFVNA